MPIKRFCDQALASRMEPAHIALNIGHKKTPKEICILTPSCPRHVIRSTQGAARVTHRTSCCCPPVRSGGFGGSLPSPTGSEASSPEATVRLHCPSRATRSGVCSGRCERDESVRITLNDARWFGWKSILYF